MTFGQLRSAGTQLLDDPALEIHGLIQDAAELCQPLLDGRPLQARLQPGQIHLGRGQQTAELIVQFASEIGLLPFRQSLQMTGQCGQLPRPIFHATTHRRHWRRAMNPEATRSPR